MRLTGKVILLVVSSVTTIIAAIFLMLLFRFDQQIADSFLFAARTVYKNILITRQWVSDHNGVFVHKTRGMRSNPFLHHPDLVTTDGDTLTLKNPALVTRELSEMSRELGSDFSFHLASRNYMNPLNKPDAFEEKALIFYDSTLTSDQAKEFYRFEKRGDHIYFRYFAPLYTQESCLSCHSGQGYRVGDLRGGISVLLNVDSYPKARQENMMVLAGSGVLAIGFLSLLLFVLLRRTVLSPLKKIETAAQLIEQGNFDSSLNLNKHDEIGHLAASFEKMRQQIKSYTDVLRSSEQKYRSLIEHSLEAIAIVTIEGNILECNRNLLRLTGYNAADLKGTPFRSLIADKRHLRSPYQSSLSSETEHFETLLTTRGKLTIPVEVYAIKGFSLGDLKNLSFYYVRDLSEQKKLEKLSIQAEKMVALGQLSAGIAHEIRNPLFSLNNNLDYLRDRCSENPVFSEIYPEMKTSVDCIHRIVTDILDFSRPHEPKFTRTSIEMIIDSALRLVRKNFEKSNIIIEKQVTDTMIECDPHLIEQMFINLFLNAFAAMEQKGTLSISCLPVNQHVEIKIKDTGKGIPNDELRRIFEPFYSRTPGGTGLGLAIVQRILEQHQADYRVESEPMLGTTFIIHLPLEQEKRP